MFEFDQVLLDFYKFYNSLQNKKDIFYIFFTRDLLFFLKKSLSFIPAEVNLVLVGAGLSQGEILWVNNNLKRIFFHIDSYCDDKEIWELLFKVNKNNFGWIDVDCFVFNPNLFKEMAKIDDKSAINCVWTYRCEVNTKQLFLNTYFLFINVDIINKIKELGIEVSPRTYRYEETDPAPYTKSNVLKTEHLKIIENIIPKNQYARMNQNNYNGHNFFDTLLIYQMIAENYGYKLNRVRQFDNDNYFSNEIIHIGGISFLSSCNVVPKSKSYIDFDKIILMISYEFLSEIVDELPFEYKEKIKYIVSSLNELGVQISDIRRILIKFLKMKKLNDETIDKLIYL